MTGYMMQVPELPPAFQARPALLAELKQRVLGMTSSTTSLVGVSRAAAATTSAHGMGCGKRAPKPSKSPLNEAYSF
jgi:hypothetical protein